MSQSYAASPSFLGEPVEVVAEHEMPASMAKKVEGLLHNFANARLDVWFERDGFTTAEAREVPVQVIDEAINLLQAESIQNYGYDSDE